MPEHAYQYAIPAQLSKAENIRVYGFHGTSHKFVSEKVLRYLGKAASKIITIHLGNGCSMTAVNNGKSIDTTSVLVPSNGLIMGTRAGDIDQSVIFHLMDSLGYTSKEVNQLLQKKSGLLGLTGFADLRDVQKAASEGNRQCQMTLEMIAYRIKKYIGAYASILNGLDAIVFTAGIGENSALIRAMSCDAMDYVGISIDVDKNDELRFKDGVAQIEDANSKVKILVVPTNEELEIAKQSYTIIEKSQ